MPERRALSSRGSNDDKGMAFIRSPADWSGGFNEGGLSFRGSTRTSEPWAEFEHGYGGSGGHYVVHTGK